MKRCKHRNVEFKEVAEEWISHLFENGEYVDSEHNAGDPLPKILISCKDCKREFTFTRNTHPQWVQTLLDKIIKAAEQ